MATYGEVTKGEALIAQFLAHKLGSYLFELHPELWTLPEIGAYYDTRTWVSTRFTNPSGLVIPSQAGIYMFVVAPHSGKLQDHSYIFYVGKTKNLSSRYEEYLEEQQGRGTNPRENVVLFLHHLQEHVYFHYSLVPESELDNAEKLLKDNLTPPGNTQKAIIGRLSTG